MYCSSTLKAYCSSVSRKEGRHSEDGGCEALAVDEDSEADAAGRKEEDACDGGSGVDTAVAPSGCRPRERLPLRLTAIRTAIPADADGA